MRVCRLVGLVLVAGVVLSLVQISERAGSSPSLCMTGEKPSAGLGCRAEVSIAEVRADTSVWLITLTEPGYARYHGSSSVDSRILPTASTGSPLSARGAETARADYLEWLEGHRLRFLERAAVRLGRPVSAQQVLVRYQHAISVELGDVEAEILNRMEGVRSMRPVEHFVLQTGGAAAPARQAGSIPASENWWNRPIESGAGAVIGVIDTPIDATAPQLESYDVWNHLEVVNSRGRYYGLCAQDPAVCNFSSRLIGLYDFGLGIPTHSGGFSHGTLIASVAAGARAPIHLSHDGGWAELNGPGRAPHANLISYAACEAGSVWDEPGLCREDRVLAALEQAAFDRVDVLLFAAGGPIRDPWKDLESPGPTVAGTMLDLLVHEDVLVVAAAGNTGPAAGTTTYPANAPWVLSVGGQESGNRLYSSLSLRSESGTPISGGYLGVSMTPAYPPRNTPSEGARVVRGKDKGSAACAVGPKLNNRHCGLSIPDSGNPFTPGTFSGEIVICENHGYSPVQISENLRRAGAGGMVLANTQVDQDSSLAFRSYCLPTVHLDSAQAKQMDQSFGGRFAAGGAVLGYVFATSWHPQPWWAVQGVWSPDSARGPDEFTHGVQIPRVMAQGNHMLAARTQDPGIHFVDITHHSSVAAGLAAGAAARVRASRPKWSATQALSALSVDGQVVDERSARQRSLVLPEDFKAAGRHGLNLASQVNSWCFERCTFSWTLEATQRGSWRVSNNNLDLVFSPSEFSLNPGEKVTVQATVEAAWMPQDLNQWHSRIVSVIPISVEWEDPADYDYSPSSYQLRADYFAAAVADISEIRLANSASRDRHQRPVVVSSLVGSPEFTASAAVNARVLSASLPPLSIPRSGDLLGIHEPGSRVFWLDVPAGAEGLWIELTPASLDSGRILIGRGAMGGGKAAQSETRCITPNPRVRSSCFIESPEPGAWWVAVQNAHGSGSRSIVADVYVFEPNSGNSFVHAPGMPESERITLDLGWDGTGLSPGKVGMLISLSDHDPSPLAPGSLARIPVFSQVAALPSTSPVVLIPGRPEQVHIPANTSRSGVFVDVPPTATRMNIKIRGGFVQASLRHLPLSAISAFAPGTSPMPTTVPAATGSGSDFALSLDGEILRPGRWYLELRAGEESQRVEVSVSLEESGRIEPLTQLWHAVGRSTNQGVSWQEAGPGFIVWYAYNEDHTPVFYMAIGHIDRESSVWSGDLIRVAGTIGRQFVHRVGKASITTFASDDMVFSWQLKGAHGSERMQPIAPQVCPIFDDETFNLMGHWEFGNLGVPSGGGLTAVFTDLVQAQVYYFFDEQGEPRWVIAAGDGITPQDNRVPILHFRGYCPYCAAIQPIGTDVGTLYTQFVPPGEFHQSWMFQLPYNQQQVSRSLVATRFSTPKPCR